MKMNKQKMIITIAILFLIVFAVNKASCVYNRIPESEQDSIRTTKYNHLAVELNNKAMSLWQKEILKSEPDRNVTIQVTKLLDSSITLDSSYYLAYTNKITILCGYGRRLEAIATMEKCIRKVPDFAEGIDFLGMLYESLGRKKEAMQNYEKALTIFEKRYKEKHSFNDRCNGILILLKSERKAESDILVDELPHEFPDKKKEIASFLDLYTTYDNNEIIKDICRRRYK